MCTKKTQTDNHFLCEIEFFFRMQLQDLTKNNQRFFQQFAEFIWIDPGQIEKANVLFIIKEIHNGLKKFNFLFLTP